MKFGKSRAAPFVHNEHTKLYVVEVCPRELLRFLAFVKHSRAKAKEGNKEGLLCFDGNAGGEADVERIGPNIF